MIATSGNLELDSGSISTNGHNGYTGSSHAGGGAGGSVWITATAVTGTGSIVSNGGSTSSYSAGGGGGGRIAIYVTNLIDDTVTLTASSSSYSPYGGAGTIYTSTADKKQLMLDNTGYGSTPTLIDPAAITADKVHVVNVTRSANLQVTSGEVLRVPTLEVLAKITGDNINIRTTELRVVGSIVGETSVTISDDSFSASDALSPCNHGDDLEFGLEASTFVTGYENSLPSLIDGRNSTGIRATGWVRADFGAPVTLNRLTVEALTGRGDLSTLINTHDVQYSEFTTGP